jgi:hypothetical protein
MANKDELASASRSHTKRPTITLGAYLHTQLNALVGIYGPSLSEVVGFIVQSWLHDNDEKVTRQMKRYAAFRRTVSGKKKAS